MFSSYVPLEVITLDFTKDYSFEVNNSGVITTKLVLTDNERILKSVHSSNLPKVLFDVPVSYDNDACFQYVFDFNKGVIYIIGEDIIDSIGAKG